MRHTATQLIHTATMATLSVLLAGLAAPAQSVSEAPPPARALTKSYALLYADPSETLTLVRQMLGGEGEASWNPATRRLSVTGTAEQQDQIGAVLAELDRPPDNVQVQVRIRRKGLSTESEFGAKNPKIDVTTPGRKTIKFDADATARQSGTFNNTVQLLMVASGREASLFIGEEVPYRDWLLQYAIDHGYRIGNQLVGELTWKRVGAKLSIQPTILADGQTINIRLVPELSDLDDPKTKTIKYIQMATEVTAVDGQPISIGGLADSRDFYHRFMAAYDAGGNPQGIDITLLMRIRPARRLPAGK